MAYTISWRSVKLNKTYYNFRENFKEKKRNNKFKNFTFRKRKLLPLTSEYRLKDLPSISTKIPTDSTRKIESAKEIFRNIIKRVPPENDKKFKIDNNQSNNIDINEIKYESDEEFSNWY